MTPVFSKCKCAAGDGIVSRENCHNPDCDTKFSIFFIFQVGCVSSRGFLVLEIIIPL